MKQLKETVFSIEIEEYEKKTINRKKIWWKKDNNWDIFERQYVSEKIENKKFIETVVSSNFSKIFLELNGTQFVCWNQK
jgi:hypothetical protein